MKLHTPKLLVIVILSIALLSCSNDDNGIYFDESSETVSVEKAQYSAIESDILDLVNAHRKSIGLSSLKPLDIVSNVAEGHTNYMIESGQISHDNFNVRTENLIKNANAKSVGENVAYGYGSAQGAVNGWLNSDGHRKVIESTKYTHFGISTHCNTEGRNYFTQIFINK